jgi:hypothetical protein
MKILSFIKLWVHYFKVVFPSMSIKKYYRYHLMISNLEKSF